ncbi:MAG: hypothetical protein IJH34_08255 [Romboutsia sp.]|nr:hypothetical protein [Romboutsia sp.]
MNEVIDKARQKVLEEIRKSIEKEQSNIKQLYDRNAETVKLQKLIKEVQK